MSTGHYGGYNTMQGFGNFGPSMTNIEIASMKQGITSEIGVPAIRKNITDLKKAKVT